VLCNFPVSNRMCHKNYFISLSLCSSHSSLNNVAFHHQKTKEKLPKNQHSTFPKISFFACHQYVKIKHNKLVLKLCIKKILARFIIANLKNMHQLMIPITTFCLQEKRKFQIWNMIVNCVLFEFMCIIIIIVSLI